MQMKNRNAKNQGQVSLEYLIIVAFMLIAVAILSIYSFTYLGDAISIRKAQNAVDKITNAADSVAALGSGNTSIIQVELPPGVQSAAIIGQQVTFTTLTGSGINAVSSYSGTSLTESSLSTEAGFHTLSIAALDSNVVVTEV